MRRLKIWLDSSNASVIAFRSQRISQSFFRGRNPSHVGSLRQRLSTILSGSSGKSDQSLFVLQAKKVLAATSGGTFIGNQRLASSKDSSKGHTSNRRNFSISPSSKLFQCSNLGTERGGNFMAGGRGCSIRNVNPR